MSFYLPGNSGSVTLGLPLDGLTGQALVKASDVDFDVKWGDLPAGGNGNGNGGGAGSGTSVGFSAPEGFRIFGSPVTGSGTLQLAYEPGYSLPPNLLQDSWTAGASLAATSVQAGDARLFDARPWNASLMSEAEARAGSATTARQTTAQRLRQAAEGWWDAVASTIGKALATAATQAAARASIGAEAAGAAAAAQAAAIQRGNHTGEQAISTITSLGATLAAKADLVSGLVPTSQIPSIALVQFLGAVASQSAMLALRGQPGDWAIRTDRSTEWVIIAGDGATLGDWYEMPTGIAPVGSVNNQTGSVILGFADVGAASDNDSRLGDSREWSAPTVTQTEAQAGTGIVRLAWTVERVWQAIAAWWLTVSSTLGRSLVGASNPAVARSALELGSAAQLNHGTTAGSLVRLDPTTGRLPQVDGSQLTNLPGLVRNFYAADNWIMPVLAQVGTGAAKTQNRLELVPFTVERAIAVSQAAFRVGTGVASSTAIVTIYASTSLNQPGVLMAQTGALSTASATMVSGGLDTPINLYPNTIYWWGIIPSAAVTLQRMVAANIWANYILGAPSLSVVNSAAGAVNWVRTFTTTGTAPVDLTSQTTTVTAADQAPPLLLISSLL